MAHHDPSQQIAGNANTNAGRAALGSALALACLLSAVLFSSVLEAARFVLSLAIFVVPGVPVARRWFRGPEAYLVGAALGYFASSLVATLLVRFELLSTVSVLAGSLALYLLARVLSSPLTAGATESGERTWLGATFFFCLLLVAIPFLEVGARVPGGVAYRAYFSADLMTHLSVVSELQKPGFPPENPFYAGDGLSYYWLFFLGPAAFGSSGSNQPVLLSLYLFSGLLFGGLLFVAARQIGLPPKRAFLATAVALGAVSYEGVFALGTGFRDMNVDALARWVLGLVSLDGLHRGLLYTPQHLFSYSLLVVLLTLVLRGEPRDRAGAVLAGVLLGGMAGTSIVTAMLAGPWLMLVMLTRRSSPLNAVGPQPHGFSLRDSPTARSSLSAAGTPPPRLVAPRVRAARRLKAPLGLRTLRLALWTCLVALGFLWVYVSLGFFGDAGGALVFRLPQWSEPFSVLLLDAGALVLLVLLRGPEGFSRKDLEIAALAAMSLLAVLFLDLEGYEGVWMAWRAGSVLLVSLGFLAAPALGGSLSRSHALILAPAVLTVALDVWNAQDLSNRSLSAGDFRWTTVVSGDEWEALQWIRVHTPEAALVQWDVRAREPGEWALIPAIAERRMAVGSPIFLLDLRKYRVRERREVRPIFASGDAVEAHRLAKALGIDYLFLGSGELRARGERLRELFESKELFRLVFENDGATVLEVLDVGEPP